MLLHSVKGLLSLIALKVFFLILPSLSTFAQGSKLTVTSLTAEWNEGTTLLNDGTQLEGILWYNDHTGVLSFERGGETRAFVSRNVASFQFYDQHLGGNRYFYSLPYEDPRDNAERMLFFELMKDLKDLLCFPK